jgi:hypothetical protein
VLGVTVVVQVDPAERCSSPIYATPPGSDGSCVDALAKGSITVTDLCAACSQWLVLAVEQTGGRFFDWHPNFVTRTGGELRGLEMAAAIWVSKPDFAALFPVCSCGKTTCRRCGDWQLTPRMASVLWTAAQLVADDAYGDVVEHGDEPVAGSAWAIFDLYPVLTYRQDAIWRRQAARAYDDLTEDLEAGRWPRPRCPAEELALHQCLQHLIDWEQDPEFGPIRWDELEELPAHEGDRDWGGALTGLFQDHDILNLYDLDRDGIEDPDSLENQITGMGDYRPAAWFNWFGGHEPRHAARPFRR